MTDLAFQARATAAGFTPQQSILLETAMRGSLDGTPRARPAERTGGAATAATASSECAHP
eukprot:1952919-Amphidinium_carterae.1